MMSWWDIFMLSCIYVSVGMLLTNLFDYHFCRQKLTPWRWFFASFGWPLWVGACLLCFLFLFTVDILEALSCVAKWVVDAILTVFFGRRNLYDATCYPAPTEGHRRRRASDHYDCGGTEGRAGPT